MPFFGFFLYFFHSSFVCGLQPGAVLHSPLLTLRVEHFLFLDSEIFFSNFLFLDSEIFFFNFFPGIAGGGVVGRGPNDFLNSFFNSLIFS